MTTVEANPYAPPKAAVADVAPASAAASPPFFAVSKTKLVIMSLTTLTLYQLVWFYMHWRRVNRSGAEVAPLVRTIFAPIFCYALFDRVRWYRKDLPSSKLSAGLLALGWIVVTVGSSFLDRVTGPPLAVFIISMVVGHSSVLFMLPVQSAADAINHAEVPDHDRNDRFTVWNWIWIVVGGLLTLAGTAGTLLPE